MGKTKAHPNPNANTIQVDVTSEEMFLYHPNVPGDMRYAVLNRDNPRAKGILNAAKAYAAEAWKYGPGAHGSAKRALLERRLRECHTGELNHLACMMVISHQWQGATGQGGVWSMASELANEMAREVLKERPMFEVVGVVGVVGVAEEAN